MRSVSIFAHGLQIDGVIVGKPTPPSSYTEHCGDSAHKIIGVGRCCDGSVFYHSYLLIG
jgi:hypothetical protein